MIRRKQVWSLVVGGLLVLGLTSAIFAQTAIQPANMTVGQVEPGNAVVVSEVTAPVSSWVVIHRDEQGTLGPVIGRTPVPAGATPNVVVTLDEDVMAGDQLWVALYADGGQTGTLELDNGTDTQMILSNGYAAQSVTVGQAGRTQDQQQPSGQAQASQVQQPQAQQEQAAETQTPQEQATETPDVQNEQDAQGEQLGVAAAIQAAQQEQPQEQAAQATEQPTQAQQTQQPGQPVQPAQQPTEQDPAQAQGEALQAQIEQAQVPQQTLTPQAEQPPQTQEQPQQLSQGQMAQAQTQSQADAPPATMPATGAGSAANPLLWLASGLAVVGLFGGEKLAHRLRGRSAS